MPLRPLPQLGAALLLAAPALAQSYGPVEKLSTGLSGADHVVASDLNGDGVPDLVFSNSFVVGAVPRFSSLVADGAGGYSAPIVGPVATAVGGQVVIDVNRDKHPDLVLGGLSGRVQVYQGDGTGAFPTTGFTGTAGFDDTRAVLVDDVIPNGQPDIVTIDSARTVIYHGDGTGGFASTTILPQGTDGNGALADIDENGLLDLIMTDRAASELEVFMQLAPGSFTQVSSPVVGGQLGFFGVGDLNSDGFCDVYLTTSGRDLLLFGDGTGAFAGSQVAISGNRSGTVHFCDVEGDGDTDVVVGRFLLLGNAGIDIYENDGNGNLTTGSTVARVFNGYLDALVHDLDVDGRPDVVGLEFVQAGEVSVLLHTAPMPAGLTAEGPGTPGCAGLVGLAGDSVPAAGNLDFGVLCTNAPPRTIATGLFGSKAMPGLVFQGLNVHLSAPIVQAAFMRVDSSGVGRGSLPIPNLPILVGVSTAVQCMWPSPWASGDDCTPASTRLITSQVLELTIE